jgi:hypothetical protein
MDITMAVFTDPTIHLAQSCKLKLNYLEKIVAREFGKRLPWFPSDMKPFVATPRVPAVIFAICILLTLSGCGGGASTSGSNSNSAPSVLNNYHLTGADTPIRDPSIMRQAGTYYLFRPMPEARSLAICRFTAPPTK